MEDTCHQEAVTSLSYCTGILVILLETSTTTSSQPFALQQSNFYMDLRMKMKGFAVRDTTLNKRKIGAWIYRGYNRISIQSSWVRPRWAVAQGASV